WRPNFAPNGPILAVSLRSVRPARDRALRCSLIWGPKGPRSLSLQARRNRKTAERFRFFWISTATPATLNSSFNQSRPARGGPKGPDLDRPDLATLLTADSQAFRAQGVEDARARQRHRGLGGPGEGRAAGRPGPVAGDASPLLAGHRRARAGFR